jgi:hypothetical protein
MPALESELLQRINQGLPASLQERYRGLVAQRRTESLSSADHAELLRLTDQVEQFEADRARALVELAELRQVPLTRLVSDLGLQAPPPGAAP